MRVEVLNTLRGFLRNFSARGGCVDSMTCCTAIQLVPVGHDLGFECLSLMKVDRRRGSCRLFSC